MTKSVQGKCSPTHGVFLHICQPEHARPHDPPLFAQRILRVSSIHFHQAVKQAKELDSHVKRQNVYVFILCLGCRSNCLSLRCSFEALTFLSGSVRVILALADALPTAGRSQKSVGATRVMESSVRVDDPSITFPADPFISGHIHGIAYRRVHEVQT